MYSYYSYKRKKEKRLKRILIAFNIIFLLWISLGLFLNLRKDNKKELESIGYNNIEISIIEDVLNDKQIKDLTKYPYIKLVPDLIVNKDTNINNIEEYLIYYSKYPNIPLEDLIYIINNNISNIEYTANFKEILNHKDFKNTNLKRYTEYYNKYKLNVNDTIYAVNNDLDIYNIKYLKEFRDYLKNNLCIKRNLERYYEYKNKFKELSIAETITKVNNNLDLIENNKTAKTDTTKNNHIIVNRYYYLDKSYIPNNLIDIEEKYGKGKLNKETYNAYIKMYNEAKSENIELYILNGYISYEEQEKIYKDNPSKEKPGHSEAQTGLTLEITNNKWLTNNAYKFGFILRYPNEYKDLTGYNINNYYRYVGKEISLFLYNNKMTYDEYYEYFLKNK